MENLDSPNDLAVKSMLFLILLNPASVVTNEMVEIFFNINGRIIQSRWEQLGRSLQKENDRTR